MLGLNRDRVARRGGTGAREDRDADRRGASGPPARRGPLRLVVAVLTVLPTLTAPAPGQQRTEVPAPPAETRAAEPGPLVLHAYTLQHQPAGDAMTLIFDLLSPRGTVQLQPGGNTLVIRDTLPTLQRILPVLAAFDHAVEAVQLDIQIVRASAGPDPAGAGAGADGEGLSAALVKRLRDLLRYQRFGLVARAALDTQEGEAITYNVGQEYAVGLRMGTLLADGRIRLYDFRLLRRLGDADPELLVEADLNLWKGEPMVLGLARSEASDSALMVVLTVEPPPGEAD